MIGLFISLKSLFIIINYNYLIFNRFYLNNKIVIRETKRIFCKKLFQKKIPTNTNADRDTYNNSEMTNKTSEDYFED